MSKLPIPYESSQEGPNTYQNFIRMVPLKENNNPSIQQQSRNELIKTPPPNTSSQNQVPPKQQNTQPINQINYQNPVPQFQQAQIARSPSSFLPGAEYVMPNGKNCDRCKCMLPQQILRMKQQIIRLQNTILEQKDRNSNLKFAITEESNKKIRQLEEYIDRLHDETSIKSLLQQIEELKDKQSNSLTCLSHLSQQNARLQRECEKMAHRFTDLKQKSRFLSHQSRSRTTSRWKFDTEMSEFGDVSEIGKSNSYINQLEDSNMWLKKQNKRLTDIIAQGMKLR